MEIRNVAPKQGWLWVLQGFVMFRAYPAFWLLLLLFYWLGLVVVSSIPFAGPLVATALIPGLAAGFMAACQAVSQKRPPLPSHLLSPFRVNPRAQGSLGLAYIAALALVLGVSALIDGGTLFRMMLLGAPMPEEMLRTPALQTAGLVAMALYVPLLLAFWFAPALCLWQGMTPAKALFFSFFAGLRNTRAFLVYGLGWLLFAGVIPMVLALVLGLMLPRRQESTALVALILTPYMLIAACAMLCSFYASYVAIFVHEEVQAPPPAAP